MRDDFAVFITTHGRPQKQLTYELFRRKKYTGKTYFVIDDLDSKKDEYIDKYGDDVLIFDKMEYVKRTDTYTNKQFLSTVTYARNAVEDFAIEKGLRSYISADDDITDIGFRYPCSGKAKTAKIRNLDAVFGAYSELVCVDGVDCICVATPNFFIGGADNSLQQIKRKGSNLFFRNTKKRLKWESVINQDMILSVLGNMRGLFIGTVALVDIHAKETGKGKSEGGMINTYRNMDSYSRSFHAVMACPSICKVRYDGKEFGIQAKLNHGVPEVISDKHRKRG